MGACGALCSHYSPTTLPLLARYSPTTRPRVAFTADLRYNWARADLGRDFVGYNKIDLSGVSTALGFTVRL